MPNARIEDNVIIEKAIVGADAVIGRECRVGNGESIAVVAANSNLETEVISDDMGLDIRPREIFV